MCNSTDSYNKAFNNTKINTVSGALIKSHPKSFFKAFDMNSQTGRGILLNDPSISYGYDFCDEKKIVVLQIMMTGNSNLNVLAEIVFKDDYLNIQEK